jgi:hypothetical protein
LAAGFLNPKLLRNFRPPRSVDDSVDRSGARNEIPAVNA